MMSLIFRSLSLFFDKVLYCVCFCCCLLLFLMEFFFVCAFLLFVRLSSHVVQQNKDCCNYESVVTVDI